jgi:ribosomal protein S21
VRCFESAFSFREGSEHDMLLGRDAIKRIPWTQLFVEAVLIVLSVLLALAMNNWNRNRVSDNLADQALRNLKREVQANRQEVEASRSRNQALLDTLRSEAPPRGISLRTADIQNNAWEAAQATGAISNMDFSVVSIASRIEEKQAAYRNLKRTVSEMILRGNFGGDIDEERVPEGLRIMVGGLRGLEEDLITLYDKFSQTVEA